MAGLFKSLFGKRTPNAPAAPPSSAIENMPFEEVVAYCKALGDTMPYKDSTALVRRLYNIALYDHHVPHDQREAALFLAGTLGRDVEAILADNPDGLAAFKAACRFMEENAAHRGVTSLAWKLAEDGVPNDQVIPYIMRPEHGHLLGNFLAILDPAAVQGMKPLLVRYLIHLRPYGACFNAVLLLHAIAAHGDKAAAALFTEEEYRALLNVPDDYDAARGVLVGLGLLPSASASIPMVPPGSDGRVAALLARVLKQRNAADENDGRLADTTDGQRSALLLALVYLRFYLARHMLRQLCSDEVSSLVTAMIKDQDAKDCFVFFERKAEALAGLEPGTPCDYVLVMEVMSIGGIDPKTEEEYERDKAFLALADDWLNHERADFLSYLRFLLRLVSTSPDAAQETPELLWQAYLRGGAEVGNALCFEDWIGVDP